MLYQLFSFHEQVIGAHSFINRAQTNTDMARGYTLLLETLNSFAKAPVLPFDAKAIAIFDEKRSQKVRVSTMDLRIAAIAILTIWYYLPEIRVISVKFRV